MLTPDEKAPFRQIGEEVTAKVVADVAAQGLPAQEVYELMANCRKVRGDLVQLPEVDRSPCARSTALRGRSRAPLRSRCAR